MSALIAVTREQVLGYRRRVGHLDARLPWAPQALRAAAWAGLQDSVPRAALTSLHARVAGVTASAWEAPGLVQVWGPRSCVFVVAEGDRALFTTAIEPEEPGRRARGRELAAKLAAVLAGGSSTYAAAGHAMGENPVALRHTGATGRVLIRWDGARQPTVRIVDPPDMDAEAARLEVARRFLRVAGPATPDGFAWWASLPPKSARAVFATLGSELVSVRTPVGEAWALAADETLLREATQEPAAARLLSAGDPYLMCGDRFLLLPDPAQRTAVFAAGTVWPGAVMVRGELAGTWRRAGARLTVSAWRTLTGAERDAIAAEAAALPLPDLRSPVSVSLAG